MAKKYGISRKVHRAVWEAVNGPIPKGLSVCHHCDKAKHQSNSS